MRTIISFVACFAFVLAVTAGANAYNPPWPSDQPGGTRYENGFEFTLDYYNDSGWDIGDANDLPYEVWEVGARITHDRLEFSIWQNLPKDGIDGPDSYSDSARQVPGDLWIVVGSCDPFAEPSDPDGISRYAIALTTHGNVVEQKYPDEVWPEVTEGNLYLNAEFATGTYEEYEEFMRDNDYWYWPEQPDGDFTQNSYMTLIKGFEEEVTGRSGVTWTYEPYWNWDEDAQAWYEEDAWRITGWVDRSAIGLGFSTDFALFYSQSCGNDGAAHCGTTPPIPEPGSLFTVAAGLLLARKRRR